MKSTTPPVTAKPNPLDTRGAAEEDAGQSSLLMMGFPSRIVEAAKSLCACHSRPTRGGYLCSRCNSKVCSLPASCPACGLTLILSTHLARSYHHLFPLRNWREVSWRRVAKLVSSDPQPGCFGCGTAFPDMAAGMAALQGRNPTSNGRTRPNEHKKDESGKRNFKEGGTGVSESGRYECLSCGRFFCIDCDVFTHEIVHNCPGCLSRESVEGNGAGI